MHRTIGGELLGEAFKTERFHQVVHCAELDGGADAVAVTGGGDHDDVGGRGQSSDSPEQIQAVLVRQIQVEQHEIRLQFSYRRFRFCRRVRLPHDAEVGYALDVRSIDVCDPEVVVDDECADHLTVAVGG